MSNSQRNPGPTLWPLARDSSSHDVAGDMIYPPADPSKTAWQLLRVGDSVCHSDFGKQRPLEAKAGWHLFFYSP